MTCVEVNLGKEMLMLNVLSWWSNRICAATKHEKTNDELNRRCLAYKLVKVALMQVCIA